MVDKLSINKSKKTPFTIIGDRYYIGFDDSTEKSMDNLLKDFDNSINVYLSFNRYGVFRRIAIFLGMNLVVSPRKAVALNALLTAKRKYINAAIDEINQKFGSLDLYIKNIIGLTDEDIKKLRKQYVN